MIKGILCCLKNDIAKININPCIMATAMHYTSSINSILIQKKEIQGIINIYTVCVCTVN